MYICIIAHRLGYWLPAFQLSDTLGCVKDNTKKSRRGVKVFVFCVCVPDLSTLDMRVQNKANTTARLLAVCLRASDTLGCVAKKSGR